MRPPPTPCQQLRLRSVQSHALVSCFPTVFFFWATGFPAAPGPLAGRGALRAQCLLCKRTRPPHRGSSNNKALLLYAQHAWCTAHLLAVAHFFLWRLLGEQSSVARRDGRRRCGAWLSRPLHRAVLHPRQHHPALHAPPCCRLQPPLPSVGGGNSICTRPPNRVAPLGTRSGPGPFAHVWDCREEFVLRWGTGVQALLSSASPAAAASPKIDPLPCSGTVHME